MALRAAAISDAGEGRTTASEQMACMVQSIKEPRDDEIPRPANGNCGSFTLSGRLQSVRNALHGVGLMLKSQHNAWLHAFASICILTAGAVFHLSDPEWCWIILAIMAVWTAEALNTALEFLADAAKPEYNPLVKNAKDVAAGGVLISAIGSVAIGLLVLGPHLLDFLWDHF